MPSTRRAPFSLGNVRISTKSLDVANVRRTARQRLTRWTSVAVLATLGLTVSAYGQSTDLVSNTGAAPHLSVNVGNVPSGRITQGFTTGDNLNGYNLSSVGLRIALDYRDPGESVVVAIHEYDSGALIDTLRTPSSLTIDSVNNFTASAGVTLRRSTRYFLNFVGTGNQVDDIAIATTESSNETGLQGWSIENGFRFDGTINPSALTMMLKVRGSARQNTPATGTVAIAGTARVGRELSASLSNVADADGLTSPSYSYQWVRVDGMTETDITDATSSAYTLAADDEGKTVKVKVTFQDDVGNNETLTSDAYPSVGTIAAASADATLRGLTLTGDGNNVPLSPMFAGTTTSYTADVGLNVATVTIAATENHSGASVVYEPTGSDLGASGHQVALAFGANVLKAIVTAENGTINTYTITVTRALPSLSIADASATEGSPIEFTVTLSAAISDEVTVEYATSSGTATQDTDYTEATGTLTIIATTTTASFTVDTTHDTTVENDETFTVMLSTPSDNANISTNSATGTILNDDKPGLSITDASGTEGSAIEFTVTLSAAISDEVTVEYATTSGTATQDTDYTAATGTLTIATTTTASFTVATTHDTTVESNETFTVTLSNQSSNATISTNSATGTINDDDDARPSLSIADASATEGSPVSFTVTLSAAISDEVTVEYATSSGTATQDTDYTAATGTLTISANTTTASFTVDTTHDTTVENDETFTVTLSNQSSNANISTNSATGTINDDDDARPSLSIADASATEGSPVSFTVTLSAAISDEVTVEYATSSGTATQDTDYTAATGTLTISANTTTASFTVDTTHDTTVENDETFTVTLSNQSSNANISTNSATGTILNDDKPGLSITNASANEGSPVTFTVTLSATTSDEVTVVYATSNGTAISGTDYTAATGTLAIAADTLTASFTVATTHDTTDETDKTFMVTLSNQSDNATITTTTATGTINDNDDPPSLSIAAASGDEGDNVVFTVTLSPASGKQVTVQYSASVEAGDDAGSDDFTTVSGETLTIAAGDTTGTLTIATDEDTLAEGDETFTVKLTSAANAAIGTATAQGTIVDDEATPSLSIADASATEGSAVVFTVTLSGISSTPVTVAYATSDDTATTNATAPGGADYTAASGTLTITAGQTQGTITVPTGNDSTDEPNEDFTVTLSGQSDNATLPDGTATGTINDNDDPPGITIAGASANEGSALMFAVTLNRGSTSNVTVQYATSHGTATTSASAVGGADYTAASGTLTIDAGDTEGTITVATGDDTTDEENETFTVTLSNQSANATLDTGLATGTITDNDSAPNVTIAAGTAVEGSGVSFTVTLGAVTAKQVTVVYGTGDSTAFSDNSQVGGIDYTTTSGTLTIAPGQTEGTVTVATGDDSTDEDNENFTVTLSNSVNATITGGSATGTITDNDNPPGVTVTGDTAAEGSSLSFVVDLDAATAKQVTLQYSTSDGTATTSTSAPGGADYTGASSQTLNITPGQTTATITINTANDTTDEPDEETFTVTLDSATNATPGSMAEATGTITDNDDPPTPTLALAQSSIGENGGSTTVTASLNHPSSQATTVTVTSTAVAPAVAADFTPSGTTLTIAAGLLTSTGTVTLAAVNNDVDAAPKEVTVSGTASNELGIGGGPASLTLTIEDDEPTPSVTLVLATNPICESDMNDECDAAVPASTAVTATLSGKSSHVTTVTVASVAVGPAVPGDFTQSGTTLTIAVEALTSTGEVTLDAGENNTDAPDKQVTVSAMVDNTQGATAPSNVTLTIKDDEPAPTVTLTLMQGYICESGTNDVNNQCTSTVASTVLTPSLSHPSSEPTTVTVLSSTYYDRSVSALTIAAGATTVSGVTLTAVDNGTDAPNNDVPVSATASNTQGYAWDPASLTLMLTIEDDEPVPTVTLTLGQNPICESNANAGGQCTATGASTAVTASQSRPSSETTTVTVSAVAVAPAVAGDFSLSGNVALVIAAGSTDSTGVVTVTAAHNETDAPPKDVTVSGAAVNPHDIAGDPAELTLTIEDDEPAPTVTLALSSTLVAEAGGVTTVTASQSHPSSEATTVTVTAEAVAAPAVAADFTQSGTTLTIPAGSTDSTGTVAVTGVNNDVDHDPAAKKVEVSGTAANPYAVAGDPPALRFELQDDDTRGFAWTPAVLVARESTAAILAVALTSEPTSNVTLRFEHDKGGVLLYFLLNGEISPVLTFTPGNWDVPQELALLHTDPPDTVDFRHLASGGDYEGYTDTYTFTVTDSATPSTAVNLSVNPPTVAEGGGEQQVTVTATLEGAALLTATEVAVTVSGDTATEGDDFGAVAAVTVTIAAEAQQGTATFALSPVADEVAEGDERLTVAGTSTGTLTVNAAVLILVDDDERGVTVSEAGLTVAEGGEAAYTVVLTSEPTGPVEVAVAGAGADAGDLTIAPAVLTFTPANWETARTVTVSAAADADAEDDAAVITHAVSGADYGENGVTAQEVAVTVTDGDTRSTTVALRVAPGAVAEAGGPVEVTVTATVNAAAPKRDLPVRMQVGTATAEEGADFAEVADFTLTIAAGTTQGSGTFGLTPVDDVLAEGNESVEVGGNVAGLAVNGTTVTITDDDAVSTAVALTVEPLSVREDAGTAEVTVTASLDAGARTSDTEVTVAVISGTATAGTDFAEVAEFGLTIAAGETEGTGTFTLTLMDDALSEGPETVRLVAQAPAGLTVTEAAVEITDDDTASTELTLSAEPAAVGEGAGATDVAVTATLDGAARDSVTIVTVTVAPGTAEAGTDYVSVGSFEVMIPVGEVSGTGTFTLTPTDDTLSEGPETVALTGSAPDGLTVTDTTLEITDDDAASTGVTLTAAPVSVAEDAGPTCR